MKTAALVLVAFVLPMEAAAQQAVSSGGLASDYTVEVFGNLGNGRLYLGDSLWGSGLAWGAGAGVRPLPGWFDRLGFEVQAAWLTDNGLSNGQVSERLDSRLVVAGVLYHFRGHERVQPYLFGGLGHVAADYTYTCSECVFDRDPVTGGLVSRGELEWRETGSKTGIAGGAGLKIALQRHLAIRSELLLTDTTPGSGYNWGWVQWQIGLGARF